MKVGIYDRYWRTLGGGEQFAGGIAEALVIDGHEVHVLGPDAPDIAALLERLGVDISAATFRPITDEASVSAMSADYDLFINCTYLSFTPSRAKKSIYVAHFPAPPPQLIRKAQQHARQLFAAGLQVAHLPLPTRLARVRDDWAKPPGSPAQALSSYTVTVANARYTSHWIERLWGMHTDVLYPPVRLMNEVAPKPQFARDPIVLVVGRFIDPSLGHCKKQVELVEAFGELVRQQPGSPWKMHVVGGCERANRDYYLAVRRAAVGLPVEVHVNASGATLRDLWSRASIYWHGAGYGEDPEKHPDRFEHFGISVVEAMSAGLVPVVFDAAGPAELVGHNEQGKRWRTREELVAQTTELMLDVTKRSLLAQAAQHRSEEFGFPEFRKRLRALVESL